MLTQPHSGSPLFGESKTRQMIGFYCYAAPSIPVPGNHLVHPNQYNTIQHTSQDIYEQCINCQAMSFRKSCSSLLRSKHCTPLLNARINNSLIQRDASIQLYHTITSTCVNNNKLNTINKFQYIPAYNKSTDICQPHSSYSFSTDTSPSTQSDVIVRVHAYYVTSNLDLLQLQKQYSNTQLYNKPDCILIPLSNTTRTQINDITKYNTTDPYIIVYQYGSVVFFNCTEQQQQDVIHSLLQHNKPMKSNTQATPLNKDDYKIRINHHVNHPTTTTTTNSTTDSNSNSTIQITHDGVTIRQLDLHSARIIGQVLAQTVGMQQYEELVDQLMSQYTALNQQLILYGAVKLDDKQLFKLCAEISGVLSNVLVQLRLLDRSELVWSNGELSTLYTELRTEFEIQSRFNSLEIKLNLMQQSTTFLLEVLHNQKSDKLEWIIIILIMIEVVISLVELPHILNIAQ